MVQKYKKLPVKFTTYGVGGLLLKIHLQYNVFNW